MNPTQSITFQADVVSRNGLRATWRTRRLEDTSWRQKQRADTYADFTTTLPDTNTLPLAGTYWLVECTLEDTTSKIRTPAIKRLAKQTFTWHLVSSA